jgi:hypothetical protein
MKKLLFLLFVAGISGAVTAQDYNGKDPFMTKSLANDAIQKVKVETTGGNISVEGVDASARVEVYIWPGNSRDRSMSKADIQKRLDEEYDLTISVDDHKLTAIAKPKHRNMDWNHSLSISFKVFVPKSASSNLTTSGGNIRLNDLSGIQDFTTSGGNLELDNLSGHVTGRTSGGNITLTNSKDDIDLITSGGNIDAEKCKGDIKLTTSGGSVSLHHLSGTIKGVTSGGSVMGDEIEGELSAHTSGGNVHMDNLSCSIETSTSGGNISVSMKSFGKYVRITNSSGNIDLEVPKGNGMNLDLHGDKINTGVLTNFSGDKDEHNLTGTVNGGGVPVTIDAGSGRIKLTIK